MSAPLSPPDPWRSLSRFTPARIGLGRAGAGLPTEALLDFSIALACARDAVHAPLDTPALQHQLEQQGFAVLRCWSCARDRAEYLRRPDLGRRLAPDCVESMSDLGQPGGRLTVVIADGLSSAAPTRHALPLLRALQARLRGWELDRVIVATEARVALGDHIGELGRAEAVLVLIGERPGLIAADSLGAYLTYQPRVGRSDAERNCISNIRAGGLDYATAASRLVYLLTEARRLGCTGVRLKDDSGREPESCSIPRHSPTDPLPG